jgi:hypothetical protein
MAAAPTHGICGGVYTRSAASDGPSGRKAAQEGVYLIERAVEVVVTVLRYDNSRQIMTTAPIFEPPQMLGLLSTATSAGVIHRRQMPLRWLTAEGYGRSVVTK